MATDWQQAQTDREIARLGERIDHIEQAMREQKERAAQRITQAMLAFLWIEIGVVCTLAVVRAAGAL